jgi:hypothetical protein
MLLIDHVSSFSARSAEKRKQSNLLAAAGAGAEARLQLGRRAQRMLNLG